MLTTPKKMPIATLLLGFTGLVATVFYYYFLVNEEVIYHSTIDIFKMYGITVASVGGVFTGYIVIKRQYFRKILLLVAVYFFNLIALYFVYQTVKSFAYEFRFSLKNNIEVNCVNSAGFYTLNARTLFRALEAYFS